MNKVDLMLVHDCKELYFKRTSREYVYQFILVSNPSLTFMGSAKCHEDDIDFISDITGYDLARDRATISYLKYKIKDTQSRREEVYNAYSSTRVESLKKRKETLKKEIEFYRKAIKFYEAEIRKRIISKEKTNNWIKDRNKLLNKRSLGEK